MHEQLAAYERAKNKKIKINAGPFRRFDDEEYQEDLRSTRFRDNNHQNQNEEINNFNPFYQTEGIYNFNPLQNQNGQPPNFPPTRFGPTQPNDPDNSGLDFFDGIDETKNDGILIAEGNPQPEIQGNNNYIWDDGIDENIRFFPDEQNEHINTNRFNRNDRIINNSIDSINNYITPQKQNDEEIFRIARVLQYPDSYSGLPDEENIQSNVDNTIHDLYNEYPNFNDIDYINQLNNNYIESHVQNEQNERTHRSKQEMLIPQIDEIILNQPDENQENEIFKVDDYFNSNITPTTKSTIRDKPLPVFFNPGQNNNTGEFFDRGKKINAEDQIVPYTQQNPQFRPLYTNQNQLIRNQPQNENEQNEDEQPVTKRTREEIEADEKKIAEEKKEDPNNLIEEKDEKDDNLEVRVPDQPITEQLITKKDEEGEMNVKSNYYWNDLLPKYNEIRKKKGLRTYNQTFNLAQKLAKYEDLTGHKTLVTDIPIYGQGPWIDKLIQDSQINQQLDEFDENQKNIPTTKTKTKTKTKSKK
jgi:hypothetical protein